MRGKRVDTLPAKQRNVAVVFQEPALFPYMNVEENIAFGSSDKDRIHLSKRARETAQLLELDGLLKQRADRLSGGEKQRTAIGRALMKNADIILMDEPFSALDAPLKQSLGERLRRLQQKLHLTILYVTHDQQEAMRLADHLVVMNEGKLIQQGTVRSVYEHPSHVFCAKSANESDTCCDGRSSSVHRFFRHSFAGVFEKVRRKTSSSDRCEGTPASLWRRLGKR